MGKDTVPMRIDGEKHSAVVEMEGGECCIMIGIVVWLVGFEWF